MALLPETDGMGLYSTDADLQAAGWILGPLSQVHPLTSGGRFGGGCVGVEALAYIKRPIIMTGSTIIVQLPVKIEKLSDVTTRDLVVFYNNAGTDICAKIQLLGSGALKAINAASATVGTSSTGVVKDNVWQYVEVKIVVGNTGSITVKVDDTQVINVVSTDTQPATATDVDLVGFFSTSSTANDTFFDDIIFMDGSGSVNNDFIGDKRIYELLPNGDDGTDADFSSQPSQSVGSTYLNTDDPKPGGDDGDTSYNYSSTVGHETLHDFENLPVTPADIAAVIVTLSAKKSDGGARGMAALLKADVKTAGTTFNPGTSYQLYREVWEQTTEAVPAAWTGSKVNAAQAGYKLVS